MGKTFLDIVFILRMINDSDGTIFQKDCILSTIEHYFSIYADEQVNEFLLDQFNKKFNSIMYEA